MTTKQTQKSYCAGRCGNIKCNLNRFNHPQNGRGFSQADYSTRCDDHVAVADLERKP